MIQKKRDFCAISWISKAWFLFDPNYPKKSCFLCDFENPKSLFSFRSQLSKKIAISFRPQLSKNRAFFAISRIQNAFFLFDPNYSNNRAFFAISRIQKSWFLFESKCSKNSLWFSINDVRQNFLSFGKKLKYYTSDCKLEGSEGLDFGRIRRFRCWNIVKVLVLESSKSVISLSSSQNKKKINFDHGNSWI